jgi:hypothetical protein
MLCGCADALQNFAVVMLRGCADVLRDRIGAVVMLCGCADTLLNSARLQFCAVVMPLGCVDVLQGCILRGCNFALSILFADALGAIDVLPRLPFGDDGLQICVVDMVSGYVLRC